MASHKKYDIEISDLKRELRGRWDQVLSALVPDLRPAIDAGPNKHVHCPFHDGANDLRIHKDFADTGGIICTCMECADGFNTLMATRRCTLHEAIQLVVEYLGGHTAEHLPARYNASKDPAVIAKKDERKRSYIEKVWCESFDLESPQAAPVRKWFATRSLQEVLTPLEDVRCHPSLAYYYEGEDRKPTYHPAMVAMIRSANGKTSTLHRTYLTKDGEKAKLESRGDIRKMCGVPTTSPSVGGAIHLDKGTHQVLSVGEGIESSLAARAIAKLPTWSLINKGLMSKLVLPQSVRYLLIWADRDIEKQGEMAARQLADRAAAAGVWAKVLLPPFQIPAGKKGIDWNDVLEAMAIEDAFDLTVVQKGIGEMIATMQANGDQHLVPARFAIEAET